MSCGSSGWGIFCGAGFAEGVFGRDVDVETTTLSLMVQIKGIAQHAALSPGAGERLSGVIGEICEQMLLRLGGGLADWVEKGRAEPATGWVTPSFTRGHSHPLPPGAELQGERPIFCGAIGSPRGGPPAGRVPSFSIPYRLIDGLGWLETGYAQAIAMRAGGQW